jgi:hypothetical protein
MKNTEDFLREICPNHTDKSKWNKSELLHILDKYQALQLQQTGVKQSVCNYCLELVDELPDKFGCKECIEKHK